MAKRQAATKGELDVARVVWKLGLASVRDVFEALPAGKRPDFWTVQTYLRRLKTKGYLHCRREGRANIYSPAARPKSVLREVVGDLIRRLFDGQAGPLVQHVMEDHDFTSEEIDALQNTLDEIKRRRS